MFCQPPSLASTGEGGRAQQCRDVTELGGNMAQISSLSLGEERAAVWQQGQTNYSSSHLVIGCPTPPLSLTRESFKLESTQSNKYNLRWARPGRSQQCYCYCSHWRGEGEKQQLWVELVNNNVLQCSAYPPQIFPPHKIDHFNPVRQEVEF